MKKEQHIEWNSKTRIGVSKQKGQNVGGIDNKEQPVDAIERRSTRQHKQEEEKDDWQGKKALHNALDDMQGMDPDSRAEESEQLDPNQFHFGDGMMAGISDGAA